MKAEQLGEREVDQVGILAFDVFLPRGQIRKKGVFDPAPSSSSSPRRRSWRMRPACSAAIPMVVMLGSAATPAVPRPPKSPAGLGELDAHLVSHRVDEEIGHRSRLRR